MILTMRTQGRAAALALTIAALLALGACGGKESADAGKGAAGKETAASAAAKPQPAAVAADKPSAPAAAADAPTGGSTLIFWHVATQETAQLLDQIVADYNATNPPMRVEGRYIGDYTNLFQKVRVTIPTHKLPDLVAAYPSMVVEYIEQDAAVPLDPYIADPATGLSAESLADIYPSILDGARYPAYGNKFYAFPFTKSVLMLYYSRTLLKQAGLDKPAETWSEFATQCAAMQKIGKKGYALSVDASTFAQMVYSFGGDELAPDRKHTLLGEAPSVAALRTITDLVKAGNAFQIDRQSYGDRQEFTNGNCAFMIRSSTTRPYLEKDIQDKFEWDMAIPPHGDGQKPVTILFGGDIAIMKTTPERQKAAWAFVKYFSTTEVTARWGTGTGYMPIRKSALGSPAVQAFLAAAPRNGQTLATLPFARTEPDVAGWQDVRGFVEQTESAAIGGRTSPENLAKDLAAKADAALAEAAGAK